MLGIAGGIIGIIMGVIFSETVALVSRIALGTVLIEASFPWYLIIGALLFSFFVGSISGILPAIQASSLQPVEALRYE
jgi:putative ABC transport system permease protein